jgi:hypothetical protein
VPILPIPQHGIFKDLPSFITICITAQPKAWWSRSHACKIVQDFLSVHRPRATLSACYVCSWLDLKALALLPGFCIVVPLLPVLKTWLPQGLT